MTIFSRREFLAQTVTVAGAAWAAPHAAFASGSGPIGIQLYSVSEPLERDVDGTLRKLHDIGYREVETAGFAKLSAKEFRKALDSAGLRCVSCHLPFDGEHFERQFED